MKNEKENCEISKDVRSLAMHGGRWAMRLDAFFILLESSVFGHIRSKIWPKIKRNFIFFEQRNVLIVCYTHLIFLN